MSLYTIPCVLFAGGKSSRMRQNKAFLPFGKYNSLIEYQIKRLQKIFEHVYVSAKDQEKFKDMETVVIKDVLYNDVSAPTTGFLNTFRQLKDENAIFILSVDAPFVNKETIDELLKIDTDDYDAIIVRTPSGIHPLCGIYTRSLEDTLKEMMKKKNYKIKNLLERSNVFYVDVQDEDLLLNLNTPDDYQKGLKLNKR